MIVTAQHSASPQIAQYN